MSDLEIEDICNYEGELDGKIDFPRLLESSIRFQRAGYDRIAYDTRSRNSTTEPFSEKKKVE